MKYKVLLSDKAKKQLEKLDKTVGRRLYNWILKNLQNCDNPRLQGKALEGPLGGFWRYRIGDYRIICQIKDLELVVLVLKIGHRSRIYQ